MPAWSHQPRRSLHEVARAMPIRFVINEALRFAGVIALMVLLSDALFGPPPARNPWRQLAVLVGGGLIAGLFFLFAVWKPEANHSAGFRSGPDMQPPN
jgi:hypothetical protein